MTVSDPMLDPNFTDLLTPAELRVARTVDVPGILSGRVRVHDYEPDGKVLKEFYEAWNDYISIIGPLGSGKTQAAIHKCKTVISEMPVNNAGIRRSKLIVLRQVEKDLHISTIPDWAEIMGGYGPIKLSPRIYQEVKFLGEDGIPVHCTVEFMALDGKDAEDRARGIQATFCWIDEAKGTGQLIVDHVFGRLGRFPRRTDMPILEGCDEHDDRFWYGAILCSNPPDEFHWLASVHEAPREDQAESWSTFNQPGGVKKVDGRWLLNEEAENLRSLPVGYYQKKVAGSSKDSYIRINLGGEYGMDITGQPVWPGFSEAVHVTVEDDYRAGDQVFAGVDYGRTPAIVLAVERDGGLLVFAEYIMDGAAATDLAEDMKHFIARHLEWDFVPADIIGYDDPSGAFGKENTNDTAHEIMRAAGIRMQSSPIPNQDLAGRLKAVVDPLSHLTPGGCAGLRFHKRCRGAIRAAKGGYQYRLMKIAGQERFTEVPDKNDHSHVADAIGYLCAGRGWGRVRREQAEESNDRRRQGVRPSRRSSRGR